MDNRTDFSFILSALLDNDHPFPPGLLYNLSGILPEECRQLAETWPKIKTERKRALLEDMNEMAEKDYLLMFEDVGRIGLHDADAHTCIRAISLLWEAEDKTLVPEFLVLLQESPEESVRAAAASALGPYVYQGEVDKLPAALLRTIEEALLAAHRADRSELVRRRALEALGYSSREEVPALLRSASARNDTLWLESALFAMGHSADKQWEARVLEFLDHEDLPVQIEAVHAAGELMLSRARVPLLNMLEDEIDDLELKNEVIWALSQIGGEGVEETLDALLEAAEDDDEIEVLEQALDNLSFNQDDNVFDFLDIEFDEDDLEEFDPDDDDFGFDDEDEDY